MGAFAIGASSTGVTVPLADPADAMLPFDAVSLKPTGPLKSGAGVNTSWPPTSGALPPGTATAAPPSTMAVPLTCVIVSVPP